MDQPDSGTPFLRLRDLGRIGYSAAYELQRQCMAEVMAGAPDTVLLCEHPPVITLGRSAKREHVLSPAEIKRCGIDLKTVDRGGDVTLHIPGQLVVYPIFNLKNHRQDLGLYIRQLEQVAIDFLGDFAILADRWPGYTGVWVDQRKIASIGIGVRKWITYHGMAININPNLEYFSLIKPCGLNITMTSLSDILRQTVDFDEVKKRFMKYYIERHQDMFFENIC